MDQKGFITLTKSGEEIAKSIYERHCVLTDLLIKIGVDEKQPDMMLAKLNTLLAMIHLKN